MSTTDQEGGVAHRLVTGAGLRVLALVVSAVIGLFMTPFLVHRLGDSLFGLWVLAASFSSTYALLDLGMSAAVGRFVALHLGKRDAEMASRYVNTALVAFILMGIGVLTTAVILTFFVSVFTQTEGDADLLAVVILITGTTFALDFPLRAIRGVVIAKLRFDLGTGIGLGFRIASVVLTVLLILAGYDLIAMALLGLVLGILRGFVLYGVVRRIAPELRIDPRMASKSVAKGFFSFSAFAFWSRTADVLRFKIDNLVIGAMLVTTSITHYTVAITLTAYFQQAAISVTSVLGAVFARQHGAGDRDAFVRTLFFGLRVAVSLVAFMAFGLIVWGRPFIQRWMGHEYLDAYPCLVLIAIGLMTDLSQAPTVEAIWSVAKHKLYAYSNSVEAVLNLALSLLLVRPFGILGVAIGTAIPMILVNVFLQPWIACRALELSLSTYAACLLRALGMAALCLVLPFVVTRLLVRPEYVSLVGVGALSVVLYVPAISVLNFTKGERQMMWRAVRRRVG